MPQLVDGPLAGLYLPDHPDRTIVNLMASIIRSRGGLSPHPPLASLPVPRLAAARHLVCLCVDGLGVAQLEHYLALRPDSPFFGAHPWSSLSTVFPATTAAAVTTFLTGCSPAEHAILSWHLNLPDLGMVSTILTSQTRTGVEFAPAEFDLGRYLGLHSHLDSVTQPRVQLSYGVIPHSRFSRAGTRWDRIAAFDTLDGLQAEVLRSTAAREPGLACVYWPLHDSLCHEHGVAHPLTLAHLAEIDHALAGLRERLHGRGATLVVSADHGIHDTPPEQRIDLAAVPGLYDCLATLPCGDAGHAACYVRPRQVARFLALVDEHLGAAVHCVEGEWFLQHAVFGPGAPHPALASRVADYLLLGRDRQAFAAPLPGEAPHFMHGNHGGMSRGEMRVPLYAVDC